MAALTVPPGRSKSGPSNLTPFSLIAIFSSKTRRPSTYFSVVGELQVNCVGSQNRLRYGMLAGFVQVAMAGVVPTAGLIGIVHPRAADTADLFTAPVTLRTLASEDWE